MKRSFTLLMSLFLVIGSMWAQVFPETSSAEAPKYYTIASFNRGGYLTNVGQGKAVEHVAATKGSIWYFTKADDNGGLHFCNFDGGYLAADKTVSETAGTWYVLANGVNTEGVSISSTNPISGSSCIDANNHNSGVGSWAPNAGDWEGTTWVFAEVTDFSAIFNVDEAKAAAKAEIDVLASESAIYSGDAAAAKANVDAVQAEGTSAAQLVAAIEAVNQCVVDYKNAAYEALEGKYFTFSTPARPNGFMKLDGNRVVGLAEASSPAAVWQFVHADNAVKVFNPYTGKYLGEPGDNSTDVPVTANAEDAAAYQLVINDKAEKAEAKVKFTSNGKSVHMAGGSVLVRWNDGGASEWTVAEISEFSGIVSLHKAAAVAAVDAYSALPEIFEVAAAKEAIDAVSATDWSAFAAIDEAASQAIPTGTFAFQVTSGDNHRDSVWVSANMETSKAIGAVEQDENAHWTLKPANGGAFYIYNVKNGLYMGNPGGNCALTESPVAAYTVEVIDAEKNVVEFKCSGQTLHASNHDDDKLMNYDGDEAASRWTIVAIVEEPVVDPNDFTSFIVNADLSTEEAWNTDGTKGIKDGMVKVSSEAAFDFCQTITLPAGQYKVTAKAAYRYAGDEQAEYDAIQAGTNTHLVKLYAETAFKNYEVNVMNRYDGASDTDYAAGNGSKTVNGKFVPNSSAAVQAWFDNGQYVNELVINVQEEGAVKIGITRVGGIAGDYVNLGAWTLTRLGDAEFDLNEADFDLDAPAYSDVTAQYIVNADFSTADGWTGGNINTGARVCEFYAGWGALELTSGKLQQEVTLPAGEYRLTAKAFFRQGQSSYTNPSKSMGYLFAGDNKVLVQTLGSVPGLGSYADNQDQAGTAFYTDNLYDNVLEFTLAEETTLNIGFETTFDEMKSWFIAGAVKLESVQPVPGALKPIFEAQAMEFCQYSNTAMSALPAVYAKWEALSTTVNEIYGAISADKKVLDIEVKRVMAEMTAMVAELEAIDEAYATYNDAKWAIFDVQDNSTPNNDDAKAAFEAAVEDACNVAEVATVADLEAKIAAFEAARQAYVLNALPKEGFAFDYTFKLANPSFETGNMDGWTLNYSADTGAKHNSGGYATGNTHGNYLFNSWWKGVYLSQEVGEVPNGKYTLTVAMAGGDAGNDATAYVIANTDTVGVNLVSGEAFKDVKVDFLVINGRIHVATVGGNDDDTAERPLGTFNQEGYWWYKADNFRLEYVGELPLEVLLSMKKEVFLAKYAEFEALTETLDYSWNAINENYYFSVQEAAMGVKDTIDNVTELAVLDEMMAAMDESVANLAKVGVAAVDYNYFKGLLEEAIGFSTMVNEEECMAAYNVFEQYGGMMFGYTASTVEDIENAAAELKAAYIKFVSNAVPAEGTMFDMTFAIQNPDFAMNLDGWTGVKANRIGGEGYDGVGGIAEIGEWGASSWDASMSQAITNLPNGKYVVKAAWMAASGIEMTFAANAGETTVTGIGDTGGNIAKDGSVVEMGQGHRGWQYVEVEGLVEDGTLTISVSSSSAAQHMWSNADAFELYYAGVPAPAEPEYLTVVAAKVGDVAIVEGVATVESISTIDVIFDRPVALAENAGWATLADSYGPTNLEAEVLEAEEGSSEYVVRFTVSQEFNGEFTAAGEYELNIPEGFIVGAEGANFINAEIAAVITIEAAPVTPLVVTNVTVGEDVMEGFSVVASTEDMIKVNFDGEFYFQGTPSIVDAEGNDASEHFEYMNGRDLDGSNSYILMGKTVGTYTITLAKASFMQMMSFKAPAEDIVLTVEITVPDGIQNINVDADAVIYDIHGRRVTEMTKGLYIVNGKKVIVK